MKILPIQESDLPAVAYVHTLAFPDAALTQLGRELVRRYYAWQLNGPHDSLGIGAFNDTELAGYCVAGVFRGSESVFLFHNKTYLIWRLITHPWLLVNKMVRTRISYGIQIIQQYFAQAPRSDDIPVYQEKRVLGCLLLLLILSIRN